MMTISFVRTRRAARRVTNALAPAPPIVTAIRDGSNVLLPTPELVPGDLVILAAGTTIPADVRILAVSGSTLLVDTSEVTGDTDPATLSAEPAAVGTPAGPDVACLAYTPCQVLAGSALAIVTATGARTKFGHAVARHAGPTGRAEPSAAERTASEILARLIVAATLVAAAMFIAAVIKGAAPFDTVLYGLFVPFAALVPLGMQYAVMSTVPRSIVAAVEDGVGVRHGGRGVERLGIASVFVVDIGALVCRAGSKGSTWWAVDAGTASGDAPPIRRAAAAVGAAVAAIGSGTCDVPKCHRAVSLAVDEVDGEVTEATVRKASESVTVVEAVVVNATAVLPPARRKKRNSAKKVLQHTQQAGASGVGQARHGGGGNLPRRKVTCMVGRPQAVVSDWCTRYLGDDGRSHPLSLHHAQSIQAAAFDLAEPASSVLALAYDETFVCLVSIVDAPVDGAVESLASLRDAGVRVILMTGDEEVQAFASAATLGGVVQNDLVAKDELVSVDGSTVRSMAREQWDEVLARQTPIFARASPHDKRALVAELQARGHVAVVVGSDVTNVPALQAADVAVTVSETASPDAVRAADLHLVRGDLRALLPIIQRSRSLPENMARTFCLSMTHAVPQLLPALLVVCMKMPPALTPASIVIFNLGTEMAPSVALAQQAPEPDLLRRPAATKRWLSHLTYALGVAGCTLSAAAMAAYLLTFRRAGIPIHSLRETSGRYWHAAAEPFEIPGDVSLNAAAQVELLGKAQASFFLTLALAQLWHTLLLKSTRRSIVATPLWDNRMLNGALCLKLVVTVVYVLTPAASTLLGTVRPGIEGYLFHFVPAVVLTVYTELGKARGRAGQHVAKLP
eukprot:CAMPEP_0170740804 /NCGR_PEP_ID=MMETSP0437-20130122/5875_1 /TAXON_ID=0 /ORGANISM="Sexangularia sp." /LENGTH=851 /DNA_ID=CAMNT_0011079321 /DNA_START=311 /DNA_END=2863 /DNA_ORIENTATION=-